MRGLREWTQTKAPDPQRKALRKSADDLEALRLLWKLRKVRWETVRKVITEDIQIGRGVVITPDPAMMMGLSTWTTGWTSCMRQPTGQYRKGVMFWVQMEGTVLAYLPSGHTMTIAGVTRPRMKARTLVHYLRDGSRVYDRIYGNPGDVDILRQALEAEGIKHTSRHREPAKVIGSVPAATTRPYFDSLRQGTTIEKGQDVRFCYVG